MVNRKFLIEWFEEEQGQHICTYEQKEANEYDLFLYRGSKSCDLQDDKSYEVYWKYWRKSSGYCSEETLDLCLLAPSNIDVRQFLEVAKSERIQFASPTSWNARALQTYLKKTGRSVIRLDNTLSPTLVFELNDTQKLCAYSGDGGAFSSTDISPLSAQSKKTPPKKVKTPALLVNNEADDPIIRERREKIKAEISNHCTTIDQKR